MTDNLNKEEYVEKLCDSIVDSMDRKNLERIVWDQLYEEISSQEWVDLLTLGEDYGLTENIG